MFHTFIFLFFFFRPVGIPDSKVKIQIEGKEFEIDASDLITIRNLGRGAYGIVDLVRHRPSGAILAVKVTVSLCNGMCTLKFFVHPKDKSILRYKLHRYVCMCIRAS